MTGETRTSAVEQGERAFREWRDSILNDPAKRGLYEEESAKQDLWLQLVEARRDAGLTRDEVAARLGVSRAQVTRIENRGYDLCSLNTLRRYVIALGCGLELSVAVRKVDVADTPEKRHLPARI